MDYTAVNENLIFKGEEVSKEIEIKLATDDIFPEPNKTFEVYLSASSGVYISPIGYMTATILNDDPELTGTVCTLSYMYVRHIIIFCSCEYQFWSTKLFSLGREGFC